MFNFENQVCDVCGNAFDKNSDVVVCPDCGTPHHRECWHKLGHCVNQDKHRSGFEWQPVKQEAAASSITCTKCGSIMPEGTLFCENCGNALANPQQNQPVQSYTTPGGGRIEVHQFPPMDFGQEEFRRRVERDFYGEVDGISMKDIAAYIGPNAHYYTHRFRKLAENPKYRTFNLTAFFFTPLWFLYRKMWPVAIATALFNFVTSIPTLIMNAVQLGVLPSSSPLMFTGIADVANVLSLIAIGVSIVFGFLATPMYKKDTIKRLKKLKAEANGDTNRYYTALLQQSGPSKIGTIVVAMFIVYFIFSSLFMPY